MTRGRICVETVEANQTMAAKLDHMLDMAGGRQWRIRKFGDKCGAVVVVAQHQRNRNVYACQQVSQSRILGSAPVMGQIPKDDDPCGIGMVFQCMVQHIGEPLGRVEPYDIFTRFN